MYHQHLHLLSYQARNLEGIYAHYLPFTWYNQLHPGYYAFYML